MLVKFLIKSLCRVFVFLLVFTAVFVFQIPKTEVAYAATCTSQATGAWNAVETWTSCGGGVPQEGDTVVIANTHTVTIPDITIAEVLNITIQDGGTLMQANNNTQTISGTLLIESGGTLTHADNTTTAAGQLYEVNFAAENVTINAGGIIDVNGRGYIGGNGPSPGGSGGANAASGGGHGGNGGLNSAWHEQIAAGAAYCDVTNPATIGSGGNGYSNTVRGTGSQGGGFIKLNVSGTLTVDGMITADGVAGNGDDGGLGDSGGAGGGINISTNVLAGTTEGITFTGGAGFDTSIDGGGGGGGCMLLSYTTSTLSEGMIDASSVSFYGGAVGDEGNGLEEGGSGLYLVKTPSTNGTLFLDNDSASNSALSPQVADSLTVDFLYIQGDAEYSVGSGKTLDVDSSELVTGGDGSGWLIIDDGAIFTPLTTTTLSNASMELHQSATWTSSASTFLTLGSTSTLDLRDFTTDNGLTLETLTMNSGSKLTHGDNVNTQAHVINLAATTMTVNLGATVDADGKGYMGAKNQGDGYGIGPGTYGDNGYSSGAGHGGNGGSNNDVEPGGMAYCNATNPTTIGSGGGSGAWNYDGGDGGGLIMLDISQELTIDGAISANGEDAQSGDGYGPSGGAGGGVNILAGTIAGTPSSFSVNGGRAYWIRPGAGGGGCVYIGYGSGTPPADMLVTRAGGLGGANPGEVGTYEVEVVNTAPTVSFNSAAQKTDGTGAVDVSADFDDDDDDDTLKAKVEYKAGADCSAGTSDPTLSEADDDTTADFGDPDAENDNAYQIGTVTPIQTSSGANTVLFDWLSATDVPAADGTYCLKVTPNDGSTDGTAQTTTLTLDNVAPVSAGDLSVHSVTTDTINLNLGAVGTDTNLFGYTFYYKAGDSGVTTSDTAVGPYWAATYAGILDSPGYEGFSSLSVNTQYVFNIWTLDSYGNSSSATEIAAYTAANAPGDPTVTAESTTSLNVVLDENSNPSNTEYAIKVGTDYVQQVDGSLDAAEDWQTYTNWGGAAGIEVTGLNANTQYTVSVKARNGNNVETGFSGEIQKYTYANAVTGVSLANATDADNYGLSLTWTNNGQTGMKIDLSSVGNGGACDTTYDVGDYDNASVNASSARSVSASPNTCYKARIQSYNGDGVLNTTDVAVTDGVTTPPSQVTGLAASASDTSSITWEWTAVTDATNYKIYRSSDDSFIGETGDTSTSYIQTTVTDGGAALSADTEYTVYARAENANDEGIASSTASYYSSANLPTSLNHDSNSQAVDTMKWTWASGGAEQDFYAYMDTPSTNSGYITDLFWTVSGLLSSNTSYTFYVKARNTHNALTSAVSSSAYTAQATPTGITFSDVSTDSITVTAEGSFANLSTASSGIRFQNTTTSADNTFQVANWTNTSLSANTQYTYSVSGINGDGDATSTASGSKYTLADAVTGIGVADATTESDYQVDLTWTNNGQTGMKIEQDTGCDGSYDATAVYDNNSTNATSPYTISDLAANTCYTYKISSYNGDGVLNSTDVAIASNITTPPAAPDNVAFSSVNDLVATLAWDSVDGATSYAIYNVSTGLSFASSTSNSYTYQADETESINFYVRAVNANGSSISSASAATTVYEPSRILSSGSVAVKPADKSEDKSNYEKVTGETANEASDFADMKGIAEDDWRYQALDGALDSGLFKGSENEKGERVVDLEGDMNRAMAATVVARYIGCDTEAELEEKPFVDVETGLWYSAPIACLKDMGIVNGKVSYDPPIYDPTGSVTRAEYLKLFIEAYLVKHPAMEESWRLMMAGTSTVFADVAATDWYVGYIKVAYDNGLIKGYDIGGKKYAKGDQSIIRVEAMQIVSAINQLK